MLSSSASRGYTSSWCCVLVALLFCVNVTLCVSTPKQVASPPQETKAGTLKRVYHPLVSQASPTKKLLKGSSSHSPKKAVILESVPKTQTPLSKPRLRYHAYNPYTNRIIPLYDHEMVLIDPFDHSQVGYKLAKEQIESMYKNNRISGLTRLRRLRNLKTRRKGHEILSKPDGALYDPDGYLLYNAEIDPARVRQIHESRTLPRIVVHRNNWLSVWHPPKATSPRKATGSRKATSSEKATSPANIEVDEAPEGP